MRAAAGCDLPAALAEFVLGVSRHLAEAYGLVDILPTRLMPMAPETLDASETSPSLTPKADA